MSLENTYLNIKEKFGNNLDLEPFSIIKSVDDHKRYWKPKNVRVLLLAESHAHTLIVDHNNAIKYNNLHELDNCPTNYVKIVYCLGYGEGKLTGLVDNSRTWQFWRIFTSCVNENPSSKFGKLEKGDTPNFNERLCNKIACLQKLKESGVWLLDASIVALYLKNGDKLNNNIMSEIIKICWKQYISQIIHETKPEKIIVIGKWVSNILKTELDKIGIPIHTQNQPRMISTKKWKEYAEKYYELCNS